MASSGHRRAGLVSSVPKDFRPWVKAALHHGWRIDQRGNHVKLLAPDGCTTIPVPSCSNNGLRVVFRNQLRKAGLDVATAR